MWLLKKKKKNVAVYMKPPWRGSGLADTPSLQDGK